jgi:hypothetical protein
MKFALIICLLVSFAIVSNAQAVSVVKQPETNTTPTIGEPEFVGNVVYIDSVKIVPLEKQRVVGKAKAGATLYVAGVGKVTASNVVTGARSSVRIPKSKIVSFIIRVKDNSTDPTTIINVFKLEQNQKKDNRFINVSSHGTFKGASSSDIAFITYTGSKYGVSSYRIDLADLQPGEYAITLDGSRDVFNMFGID